MAEAAFDTQQAPMLSIRDLRAWYGESHVLHGIDLEVPEGQVVTLLGRNGAGKSTILKSIMGTVPKRQGSICLQGVETINRRPFQIARQGIAFCPEDRGIYATLNVRENLELPRRINDSGLTTEQILDLFPNLRERLHSPGSKLSGGEQQMLAIGRILRTGARLLLLDEPTEGLAPAIVEQIGDTLVHLKAQGYTILLVEQNLRFAMSVADQHYLIDHGQVDTRYDRQSIEENTDALLVRLGV
ncbi:ABC transporter ATP-binding protein [Vreelandella janggokensis]|uniref:ABC transporter ATP-binding protein n=1 Tax=Vreelandella janggokensis TaxID=370767 RepID=UPI002854D85F|nr:ABC transporter ATP-binding protein [Halomonas janggokensis]MDR5886339.1 ABC transporter ATP-binding protein [Halomonas janggokensis]